MNRRKIILYILFACLFSWTIAFIMALCHIKLGSIVGTFLLAVLYMPGPAIATFVIQKYIYKEGFRQYGWKLKKKELKLLLYAPLFFLGLTLLTFGIIALLGNSHLVPQFGQIDFSQDGFNARLREIASGKIDLDKVKIPDVPPVLGFCAMLAQGVIAGGTINVPFMFGEEFGWRGLMVTETQKMGFLKASIFIGLIWGIWHFPVIMMGHNYPHHPYIGIGMMCLFTIALSPIFSYIRLKTKSILGPCMLHGMINATGAMYALYVANANELFSWVAGWAGIIAALFLTGCIFLFDKKFVNEYQRPL